MVTLLDTTITAVTIFKDQAQVTRQGAIKLQAGQHVLAVDKFPSALVDDSVRASGQGIRILSVDIDNYEPPAPPISRRSRAAQKLSALRQEDRQLTHHLEHLNLKRDMILMLAQSSSASLGQNVGRDNADPQSLKNLTELVEKQMAILDGEKDEALDRQLVLKNRIIKAETDLQVAIGATATRPRRRAIFIAVEVSKPLELVLHVTYTVNSASWQLSYDIQIDEAHLRLVYLAHIRQKSGEDWPALPISLSTARLQQEVSLPALKPVLIGKNGEVNNESVYERPTNRVAREMGILGTTSPILTANAENEPDELLDHGNIQLATMQTTDTGGVLIYRAQSRVAIPSNDLPHKIAIHTIEMPVALDYVTIPKISEQVLMRAKSRNTSQATLQSGNANIMVESEFIGRTRLDTILPDQDFALALSAENRIQVRRKLLEQASQTTNATTRQTLYRYQITVSNHLNRLVSITVRDQLPLSMDDTVRIELTSILPQPAEHDHQNILKWVLNLDPKQTAIIEFSFIVEHISDAKTDS